MNQLFFDILSRPHAYLDPGSGSFLIQLLIASLVGAGFLVKTFWGRITAFFSGKPYNPGGETDPDTDEDASDE